jgi:hypothetical protein
VGLWISTKRVGIISLAFSCVWFGWVILCCLDFHAVTRQCSPIQQCTRQMYLGGGPRAGVTQVCPLSFLLTVICLMPFRASIQSYETTHPLCCVSRKWYSIGIQLSHPSQPLPNLMPPSRFELRKVFEPTTIKE